MKEKIHPRSFGTHDGSFHADEVTACALLLLFGIREKLGAFLLVIVLVPTTILMQPFWFAEGSERDMQIALFLRDMAILGGLLVVTLHGAHGEVATFRDEDSFSKMS